MATISEGYCQWCEVRDLVYPIDGWICRKCLEHINAHSESVRIMKTDPLGKQPCFICNFRPIKPAQRFYVYLNFCKKHIMRVGKRDRYGH